MTNTLHLPGGELRFTGECIPKRKRYCCCCVWVPSNHLLTLSCSSCPSSSLDVGTFKNHGLDIVVTIADDIVGYNGTDYVTGLGEYVGILDLWRKKNKGFLSLLSEKLTLFSRWNINLFWNFFILLLVSPLTKLKNTLKHNTSGSTWECSTCTGNSCGQ